MRYVDKIIFRNNETYKVFYQGDTELFRVNGGIPPIPTSTEWLTFEALEDNTEIYYLDQRTGSIQGTNDMYYSINGTDWTWLNSSREKIDDKWYYVGSVTVNTGVKVYCKMTMYGMNSTASSETRLKNGFRIKSGSVKVYGNLISVYNSNKDDNTTKIKGYTASSVRYSPFMEFFAGQSRIKDISGLRIPMVRDDINDSEFAYYGLFKNCTNIKTSPSIPMPALKNHFCCEMFKGCTSLNKVICYAQSISGEATREWLSGVSSTGTFCNYGGAEFSSGESGIPTGWTVVNN